MATHAAEAARQLGRASPSKYMQRPSGSCSGSAVCPTPGVGGLVSQVALLRACKVTFGLGRPRPFSPRSPRHRAAILVCVHGPRRSGPWACERGARPASRAPSMARTRGRRTRAVWRECGRAAGLSVAVRHLPIMARQRSSRCAQFGQLGFTSNRAIVTVRAAAGRQAAYGRGLEAAAYELADDARQAPKRRVLLGVLGEYCRGYSACAGL